MECESLAKEFVETVVKQKGKLWAAASIGFAIYNSKTDANYEAVFNRADEEMYDHKMHMKEQGMISRVVE